MVARRVLLARTNVAAPLQSYLCFPLLLDYKIGISKQSSQHVNAREYWIFNLSLPHAPVYLSLKTEQSEANLQLSPYRFPSYALFWFHVGVVCGPFSGPARPHLHIRVLVQLPFVFFVFEMPPPYQHYPRQVRHQVSQERRLAVQERVHLVIAVLVHRVINVGGAG